MGILTYLKIGGALILLGVAGFFYINYHRMQNKIAAQQIEIDNLKLVQGVLEQKQAAVDAYIEKRESIRKKVAYDQKQIDKDVATVDDSGLDNLYGRYRLQSKGKTGNPGNGAGSRP